MSQSHEISEHDAAWLRTLSGLKEHEPLPPKLEAAYWKFKRVCDRGGVHVSDQVLATIAVMAGFGEPTEKEKQPPTVIDLWRSKQIRPGAKLECTWRDQPRTGKLIGVTAMNKIKLILDGDEQAEERELDVEHVKPLAQAA